MRYSSIITEVWTRLNFHAGNPIKTTPPLLEGMRLRQAGEWRLDGDNDLPRLGLIDLVTAESPGSAGATLTLFLSTKRKHGLFGSRESLIPWMERVMDAVETRPSDGESDQLLTVHNEDGSPFIQNGVSIVLLADAFTWKTQMAQITDLSYTMQLDLSFKPPLSRRATRRSRPIAPPAGGM